MDISDHYMLVPLKQMLPSVHITPCEIPPKPLLFLGNINFVLVYPPVVSNPRNHYVKPKKRTECNVVFDMLGLVERRGVVPGSILQLLA